MTQAKGRLVPGPKFEAPCQRGVVCVLLPRALDLGKKQVFFPTQNSRHPAADVRAALFVLLPRVKSPT